MVYSTIKNSILMMVMSTLLLPPMLRRQLAISLLTLLKRCKGRLCRTALKPAAWCSYHTKKQTILFPANTVPHPSVKPYAPLPCATLPGRFCLIFTNVLFCRSPFCRATFNCDFLYSPFFQRTFFYGTSFLQPFSFLRLCHNILT